MMVESNRGRGNRGLVEESDGTPKTFDDAPTPVDQPVRAINEDDDGYDPYSDLHRMDSFFEEDPWR